MRSKISLDYDPRYQGIIQIAAWGFLACFVIFVMQFFLLATNTALLTAPAKGEWDQFLRLVDSRATAYTLIQVGFIALRTLYIFTILGYLIPIWTLNRTAALIMFGSTIISLPVIILSHVFELALVPYAHMYVATLKGPTPDLSAGYLTTTSLLYPMADLADTYVNLVPFILLLVAWAVVFWQRQSWRYLSLWVIVLAFLPFGSRLLGFPLLGLLDAALTGVFFVILWLDMRRFASSRQVAPSTAPTS